MWPPPRSEPVTRSALSGCERAIQASAVASEPSVPAHHQAPPVAVTASAATPAAVQAVARSQRRGGRGGRGTAAVGVEVAGVSIRKQIPR
jgi:hypothetical protein